MYKKGDAVWYFYDMLSEIQHVVKGGEMCNGVSVINSNKAEGLRKKFREEQAI